MHNHIMCYLAALIKAACYNKHITYNNWIAHSQARGVGPDLGRHG